MNPRGEKKSKAIIVLGMHRSGTSVLTGCFGLLGVHLGRNLMPAHLTNATGHWENHDMVMVHDLLLRELDCNWHLTGRLPKGWIETPAADRAMERLETLVTKHFSDIGEMPWAIKDPRMCRLMPLWHRLFEKMGIAPAFVVTVRHPFEVANSLNKRNDFSLRKGLLLWYAHVRDTFEAIDGHKAFLVTYDQLLAHPVAMLKKIEKELGIPFPKAIDGHCSDILSFVNPGLKHHRIAALHHQPGNDTSSFSHFITLYDHIQWLASRPGREVSASQSPPVDAGALYSVYLSDNKPATIDSWASQLDHLAPLALLEDALYQLGEEERRLNHHQMVKERRLLETKITHIPFMAQIFFPCDAPPFFREENSKTCVVQPDRWQEIVCMIPSPQHLVNGLRFDPSNQKGTVWISSVELKNPAAGVVIFKADDPEAFSKFSVQSHALKVPDQKDFTLFVYGFDPILVFPQLPDLPDVPMELRIWFKVSGDQSIVRDLVKGC